MRRISNKYHIHLLLISCFFMVNPVYANMSMNDAVNIAGKQRMLTQRMLKNYAMLGMNNNYADPGKDLQENINRFDKTINSLKTLKINAQVNGSLANDEQLWLPLKKILQADPVIEKVTTLQKDLDVLLDSCNTTTELITKASGATTSEIINILGRQKVLSQRLAALYMLQVWGVSDPEFKTKLNNALDEFDNDEKILLESITNSPEINTRLKKVNKWFKWFDVMGHSNSGKYAPAIIARTADKILNEMNTITSLYVKTIK